VHVGDHVNIGWNAGIHQFCRIGDHAMVAACSKCVQDVPPFVIVDGNPCETKMINAVGLKRSGFTDEEIATAKLMHRLFYRDGLNTSQAIEKARALPEASGRIVKSFADFAASTKRGLA
jgi:UDP-N-acetylglucosamine acyltransferase